MMTLSLKLFCAFVALALFAVAAVWSPSRFNLVSAGLFFWLAAETFG